MARSSYRREQKPDECSPIERRNFVQAIGRKLAEIPAEKRADRYDQRERNHFDGWYLWALHVTMPYRYKSELAQKRLKNDVLREAARVAGEEA